MYTMYDIKKARINLGTSRSSKGAPRTKKMMVSSIKAWAMAIKVPMTLAWH